MSRLIDADALWMDVIHSVDYCDDILEFIERQPTIEPEIIYPETIADLISRQEAIDALKNMYHAAEKWGEEASDDVIKARAESCMASLIEMKLRIEKLPSAQPEIIRCKDCKYYVLYVLFGRSQGWCERLCDEFDKSLARGTEDDDFCSRAERREG